MILGLITARANSKGLPGKNMLDLGGMPLIEHTYKQAIESKGFDKIMLNTDFDLAINLAKEKYPEIEIPFKRPENLSLDTTSHAEVVSHTISHLISQNLNFTHIVILQPTTPFKKPTELFDGCNMLRNGAESVIGVSVAMHHPAEYLYKNKDGKLSYLMEEYAGKRRQEYPTVYFDNGAFYGFSIEYFNRTNKFFDENSELLIMGEESLIDIDTQFELNLARGLANEIKK